MPLYARLCDRAAYAGGDDRQARRLAEATEMIERVLQARRLL